MNIRWAALLVAIGATGGARGCAAATAPEQRPQQGLLRTEKKLIVWKNFMTQSKWRLAT